MTSVHEALNDHAARLRTSNPGVAAAVERVARDFDHAVNDADHVVDLDDQFVVLNSLRQALALIPPRDERLAPVRGLLNDLNMRVREAASLSNNTFRAYVPTIDVNGRVQVQYSGPTRTIGSRWFRTGEYATYLSWAQVDRLFPGRFQRAQTPSGAQPLDDQANDYLFSERPILDRGRPTTFGKVYEELKRELILQSDLSIGFAGEVDPTAKRPMVGLMLGREDVPAETISAHLPTYLGDRDQSVRGVRVLWLVARELANRGVLSSSEVDGWIARGGDASVRATAAETVARSVECLGLSSYNDFRQHFAGDGSGGLAYVLEHGVLALSHDQNNTQRIPDYVQSNGFVRTPTGPSMLVFDAPIPELSVPNYHSVYPDKSAFVFGVDRLEIRVRDGVRLSPAAPQQRPSVPVPTVAELQKLETQLQTAVTTAHGDPAKARAQQQEVLRVISTIAPAIADQEAAMRAVSIDLMRASQRQTGFRLRNSTEVKDLESRRDTLKQWLDRAHTLESSSRLLLGIIVPQDQQRAPQDLLAEVSAASRVAQRDNPRAVAALVRAQDGLRAEHALAQLSAVQGLSDAERLRATTSFYQRWAWLDRMTGESDKGWLYRASEGANAKTKERLEQLDRAQAQGEDLVTRAVDDLLVTENPTSPQGGTYRENRDGYATLHPAYEQLKTTFATAREAAQALSAAQAAIIFRNTIQAMEPPQTTTETTCSTDSNNNTTCTTQTVTNPAYIAWQFQVAAAQANAAFWASRAESRVNQLNQERPRLQQALSAVGIADYFQGPIDGDIGWWWGSWARFGVWSYDSMQVSEIETQVGRIVSGLHAVSDKLAPVHNGYAARMEDARRSRREALRNQR